MKVTVSSEQELELMARELLHVLYNLRHWQKEWNLHYGGELLNQKLRWEKRADDLLEKLQMGKTNNVADVKIIIESPEKE